MRAREVCDSQNANALCVLADDDSPVPRHHWDKPRDIVYLDAVTDGKEWTQVMEDAGKFSRPSVFSSVGRAERPPHHDAEPGLGVLRSRARSSGSPSQVAARSSRHSVDLRHPEGGRPHLVRDGGWVSDSVSLPAHLHTSPPRALFLQRRPEGPARERPQLGHARRSRGGDLRRLAEGLSIERAPDRSATSQLYFGHPSCKDLVRTTCLQGEVKAAHCRVAGYVARQVLGLGGFDILSGAVRRQSGDL